MTIPRDPWGCRFRIASGDVWRLSPSISKAETAIVVHLAGESFLEAEMRLIYTEAVFVNAV
jgi:hypothetical protein